MARLNFGGGGSGGGGGGGGTTKVELANVALGTQAANRTTFTYYALPELGERLLVSKFVITPDAAGKYDIDVRSDDGAGDTYLAAVNADGEYMITIPIYIEGDADGIVWVGIKNTGAASRTYTLTALRAEKFA